MPAQRHLLLLDDRFILPDDRCRAPQLYSAVICLWWLEAGNRTRLRDAFDAPCFSMADLVTSDHDWGEAAYRLAAQIVAVGARYEDLPWRDYLTESIYRELLVWVVLRKAVALMEHLRQKWQVAKLVVECRLNPAWQAQLDLMLAQHPHLQAITNLAEVAPRVLDKQRASLTVRLRQRMSEARLTKDWRRQGQELAEALDNRHTFRCGVGRWLPKPKLDTNGITFFSSYRNNSRILSSFVEFMPRPVTWLAANASAHAGILDTSHPWHWLWQFSNKSWRTVKAPSFDRLLDTGIQDDEALHQWLVASPAWQSWCHSEQQLLWNLTQCWENYLRQARPALIVTANQWGIDGWFLQVAAQRGIPGLQVLHGVLGGYLYTRTPLRSDAMVVWGEFWRNLWPEAEREKIQVCNTGGDFMAVPRAASPRRRLTYFSWPLQLAPFYNANELVDGFIRVFTKLLATGDYELTVRAHPLENPADFVQRWQRLAGPLPGNVRLSKAESLQQVLARTDVALMFRSTVMLNCLASGIPVVMPNWVDFGWNHELANLSGVYLADDWSELINYLKVEHDAPCSTGVECKKWLAPPHSGDHHRLQQIILEITQRAQKTARVNKSCSVTITGDTSVGISPVPEQRSRA